MAGTPISGLPPYTTQSSGTKGLVGANQQIPVSDNDTATYPNQAYKLSLDEATEYVKTQHLIKNSYIGNDLPPSATLRLSVVSPPTNEITIIGGSVAQNQYAMDRIAIDSFIGPVAVANPQSVRVISRTLTPTPKLFLSRQLYDATWNNQAYNWLPPLILARNTENVSLKSFSVDAKGIVHNKNIFGVYSFPAPPANNVTVTPNITLFPTIANGWTQLKFNDISFNHIIRGTDGTGGSWFEVPDNGIYQINFHCETNPASAISQAGFSVAAITYDPSGPPSGYGGSAVQFTEAVSPLRIFSPTISFATFLLQTSRFRLWAAQNVNLAPIIIRDTAINSSAITALSIHKVSDY